MGQPTKGKAQVSMYLEDGLVMRFRRAAARHVGRAWAPGKLAPTTEVLERLVRRFVEEVEANDRQATG